MLRAGLILLLFIVQSCSHLGDSTSGGANSPYSSVREQESAAFEFDDFIHREGVIVFRSWNGNFIGTDCDTDLRFLPDLHVEMVEYGVTTATYKGTYHIDSDSQIAAKFTGFDHPWPTMVVRRKSAGLELLPADAGTGFVMGNRGSTTLPSNAGSYWPFQQIAAGGTIKSRD